MHIPQLIVHIIVNAVLGTFMFNTNILKKSAELPQYIFTKRSQIINFFRTSTERRTKQNSRSLVPHLMFLYYPDRVVLFRLLKHIHCRSSRSTSRRNYTATYYVRTCIEGTIMNKNDIHEIKIVVCVATKCKWMHPMEPYPIEWLYRYI